MFSQHCSISEMLCQKKCILSSSNRWHYIWPFYVWFLYEIHTVYENEALVRRV